MFLSRLLPALTLALASTVSTFAAAVATTRPNIILIMADDMGWGQTSYNQHPVLKTPHLDAMAANGLRFDRFYAGAPNCSPTRGSVLTGRSNDRVGVENHGYALRRQEKTVALALRGIGYVTGHFGKWHLNGYSGPGAPVLASDTHHPGHFGFDTWFSVTNFFDRDPLMSRQGKFEEHRGDSSEIIVNEALAFIKASRSSTKPFFTVIWYGSPHSPFVAADSDKAPFAHLDEKSQHHHGELVAMDRSIGTLRRALREMQLADNTLVMFNSDNGGLPEITPNTVGGLRGFKNTVYEGGLRVPAIIEWPAVIKTPRVTAYPAGTFDIFPTLADITGLPATAMVKPVDGTSLKPLFAAELKERAQPLPFRHQGRGAWIDNRYKLLTQNIAKGEFELYDLQTDPKETKNIATEQPAIFTRMRTAFLNWNASVDASVAGKDYPEGRVDPAEPPSRRWNTAPEYQTYLPTWKQRPEFAGEVNRPEKGAGKKKSAPDRK